MAQIENPSVLRRRRIIGRNKDVKVFTSLAAKSRQSASHPKFDADVAWREWPLSGSAALTLNARNGGALWRRPALRAL